MASMSDFTMALLWLCCGIAVEVVGAESGQPPGDAILRCEESSLNGPMSSNPKGLYRLSVPPSPHRILTKTCLHAFGHGGVICGTLWHNNIICLQEGINLLRPFFTRLLAHFTPRV